MTTDEAARLHLFDQARNVLGHDAARTLMTALPMDARELATKDDLARLEERFLLKLDSGIHGVVTKTLFGVFAMNASLVGAVIAGMQLS